MAAGSGKGSRIESPGPGRRRANGDGVRTGDGSSEIRKSVRSGGAPPLPARCRRCKQRLDEPGALVWFERVDVRRTVEVVDGRAFVEAESETIVGSVGNTEELECVRCGALVAVQRRRGNWEALVEHAFEPEIRAARERSERKNRGKSDREADRDSIGEWMVGKSIGNLNAASRKAEPTGSSGDSSPGQAEEASQRKRSSEGDVDRAASRPEEGRGETMSRRGNGTTRGAPRKERAPRKRAKTEGGPAAGTGREGEPEGEERTAVCSRCSAELGRGAPAYGLTGGEIDEVLGGFVPSMDDDWQLFCESCMRDIDRRIWGE